MPVIEVAAIYDPAVPKPTLTHRAYGVEVDSFGEDGAMIAAGHVPDLRALAAWNHYARCELGLSNVWDDPTLTVEDVRKAIKHVWAVPVDPGDEWEWALSWAGGVTAETEGAMPFTVLW